MHLRYAAPSGDARSPVAIGTLERWRLPRAAWLIWLSLVGEHAAGRRLARGPDRRLGAVPGDLLDQVEHRNEYSGLVVMSMVSTLASR